MPEGEAGKDFVTQKEIERITREGLDKGRTKQEIYEELLPKHDRKEYVAQIIARIPEAEARAKYKAANLVLVALLALIFISNLVLPLLSVILRRTYPPPALNPIFTLICTGCALPIRRMSRRGDYIVVGLLTFVGILGTVTLFAEHTAWGFANLAFFGVASVLSFCIGEGLRSDWIPADPVVDERSATTET
jgi:hypothetical protein